MNRFDFDTFSNPFRELMQRCKNVLLIVNVCCNVVDAKKALLQIYPKDDARVGPNLKSPVYLRQAFRQMGSDPETFRFVFLDQVPESHQELFVTARHEPRGDHRRD